MKYPQIGDILIFNELAKKQAKEYLKISYAKTIAIKTVSNIHNISDYTDSI